MTPFSIEDLRRAAMARLPRAVFDYFEGGSGDERTLAANRAAFESVTLQPHCLVDITARSQAVTVLGQPLSSPLILAPVGLCGLTRRHADAAAWRAASAEGVGFTLSTCSVQPVGEVAAAAGPGFWYQLYMLRDRGITRAMIDRAREAGCGALMLTVDVPLQGPRERDIRNGLALPPRVTPRNAVDMVRCFPWVRDVLLGPPLAFGNFTAPGASLAEGARFVAQQFDSSVSWKELEWLREAWPGPLVVKGVLNPADAIRLAGEGIDAIVVSNHGGRQLDGASASFAALPAIVDAVGGRAEVLVDGGIRRGADIVKCVAMGARACLVGRAYAYGLAADGEAGVRAAIAILRREIDTALGLLGCTDITRLDRSALLNRPPSHVALS